MAWIESHQELARHPKTKKLARILGVSLPSALGHLHLFWWWAMDYAQDGDLSRYDEEDIADACAWEGEPSAIVSALCESGFIDSDEGRLAIHDWQEYAGRLIEKREQNRERKKKSRARHAYVTRPSQEIPSDDRESHRATKPNLTIPNQNNNTTTARALEEEPQTVGDAYCQVFGKTIIPPNVQSFIVPIIEQHGEAYAIELILETGEAANSPSLRYMQQVHASWQSKGISSRAEAAALKEQRAPPKPTSTTSALPLVTLTDEERAEMERIADAQRLANLQRRA